MQLQFWFIAVIKTLFLLAGALSTGFSSSYAESLLSANDISDWKRRCWKCNVEFQYDVLYGEVMRLEANNKHGISFFRDYKYDSEKQGQPVLSWTWAVDSFVDLQQLFSFSTVLYSPQNKEQYVLHYVWDVSTELGSYQALSRNEFLLSVNGVESQAFRWYQVERNITIDFREASGLDIPVELIGMEFGIGVPDSRKINLSGYIAGIQLEFAKPSNLAISSDQ